MTLKDIVAQITAPDKILHMKASVAVLIGTFALISVLAYIGLHPVSIMLLISGWAAGGAVEFTQWMDNREADANNQPHPHDEMDNREADAYNQPHPHDVTLGDVAASSAAPMAF